MKYRLNNAGKSLCHRALLMLAATGALVCVERVQAADAEITINGTIAPGTCDLAFGANNTKDVELPPMNVADLPASGVASASTKPFSLTVNNCDAGLQTATFEFVSNGNYDPTDNLRWKNLGDAKGVAIELEWPGGNNQTIGANGTSNIIPVTITSGQAVLNLTASYWHLPGVEAEAGSVSAIATVNVSYN